LTPAYTFTDIESQGQMLECVVVDISKPPSGSLTGYNAYVALSRSRGTPSDCSGILTHGFLLSIPMNSFEWKTKGSLHLKPPPSFVTNRANLANSPLQHDNLHWCVCTREAITYRTSQ
ncbi:hypothetical protein EDB89DRAFT_1848761, partial [Lactarius sanguifluus]